MKIKKYPQSHLVITHGETTIVIDPGSITFDRGFTPAEFTGADGYLITHQHADHLDPNNIKGVVESSKGKVYGNSDVVQKLKGLGVEAVTIYDRQPFTVGEFQITPVDLPHCRMENGTDGPPNTGFIIDGVLFHPGDGIKLANFTSPNVALPIAGPSINHETALEFAKSLKAKLVIPIHYDSKFAGDPLEFKKLAEPLGIEVRPLNPGEETTI